MLIDHPLFHIVLIAPEIPGNTGSIGRTCLALNAKLHLIHPLGFSLDEKSIRRAGLDYWQHLEVLEYSHFDECLKQNQFSKLFFFTRHAQESSYFTASFTPGCALIFGRESTGLSSDFIENYTGEKLSLPILSSHIRSLNLASCATAAGYECLRQLKFSHLG